MGAQRLHIYIVVALSILGGATLFTSCRQQIKLVEQVSAETLMTEQSDSMEMIMTENGRTSYRFSAPVIEGYTLARNPYREFRKGVKIITFLDDSLSTVDATLTSNYAIYYEKEKLWEAKGDVEVIKSDGKQLYTQQLFWNSSTKRIYSNVDTKIIDINSGDNYFGEGFESDEKMEQWSFRKMKGRMNVDASVAEAGEEADSTKTAEPKSIAPKPKVASTPKQEPKSKPVAQPTKPKVNDEPKELHLGKQGLEKRPAMILDKDLNRLEQSDVSKPE